MNKLIWQFHNSIMLILSLIAVFYLAETSTAKSLVAAMSDWGLFGAFVVGMFFVSSFTVAPAAIVLFNMAEVKDPYSLSVAAGLGAVVGDYIIFRFMKDRVFEEWKPLFSRVSNNHHVSWLFSSPFFVWTIPVIGAIIVASPLPDEIGITMMGISKLKNWQFLALSFLLNTLGIFAIISLARILP